MFFIAETLGMESNASLERRGSLFFSSSLLDAVDSAGFSKDLRSPSPEHKSFAERKREVPRVRTQSETQYADTEVSHLHLLRLLLPGTICAFS